MKLRVQNIQGLPPNFTVTVNSDSDLAFKGTSYLYGSLGNQRSLPIPYGTTQQFADAQINNAPRRGYETGEIRYNTCLLYTSPSPRDVRSSRMPSSA